MQATAVGLPVTQARKQQSLYPSFTEVAKILKELGVELVEYVPGNKLEAGALRLKFPEGQNEEALIQAINVALVHYTIVKTNFYEFDFYR